MEQPSNEREQRLANINAQLKERDLRPLSKLGDHTQAEFEIVDIVEIYDHSKQFFTDVKFNVLLPDGKPAKFTVRFNANGSVSDGAVMVTIINGKFALVKQWRLPLSRWTTEVPRGFGEKLDNANLKNGLGTVKLGDLPLTNIARELGEEVMKDVRIVSVTHLGNIAENSGTHNVIPAYYLVLLEMNPEMLKGKIGGSEDYLKVQLWSAKRVKSELGRALADSHSVVALSLALKHIDAMPK